MQAPLVAREPLSRAGSIASSAGIVCVEFKRVRKNALIGFATLAIPRWSLVWHGCSVLESNGRRWVGLPGKPQVGREGQVLLDERGKQKFVPTAEWTTREARDSFSDAAVAAVLAYAPEAFETEGEP